MLVAECCTACAQGLVTTSRRLSRSCHRNNEFDRKRVCCCIGGNDAAGRNRSPHPRGDDVHSARQCHRGSCSWSWLCRTSGCVVRAAVRSRYHRGSKDDPPPHRLVPLQPCRWARSILSAYSAFDAAAWAHLWRLDPDWRMVARPGPPSHRPIDPRRFETGCHRALQVLTAPPKLITILRRKLDLVVTATVVAGSALVCMADQQTGHRIPPEPHAAVPSAMAI